MLTEIRTALRRLENLIYAALGIANTAESTVVALDALVLQLQGIMSNNREAASTGNGPALTVFLAVPSITGVGGPPLSPDIDFRLDACMTVSGTPADVVTFKFARDGVALPQLSLSATVDANGFATATGVLVVGDDANPHVYRFQATAAHNLTIASGGAAMQVQQILE